MATDAAFAEQCLTVAEAAPGALAALLATGGTWAEVFAEHSVHHRLRYHQRATGTTLRPPRATTRRQIIEGAGLRVLDDGAFGFAATDDLTADGLLAAAEKAAAEVPFSRSRVQPAPWTDPLADDALPDDAPDCIRPSEKAALLEAAADAAFGLDDRVESVDIRYHDHVRRTLVATSSGGFAVRASSLVGLRVAVTLHAPDGAVRATAFGGGPGGFGQFFDQQPEALAREAVERACRVAEARLLPIGPMPVVLAPGWGGVWLHEAVGHLLEADVLASSPFAGWTGASVASPAVTLLDDPTLPDGRATYPVDDEGSLARATTLIEDGVLRGCLTDRRWADQLDRPRTGNGRRQDYRHAPLPRMTNLVLHPGPDDPAALLAAVGDGLYVEQIAGGRVLPDGRFQFEVLMGSRIERGRLTHPVAGVRLHGTSREALLHVAGVGNDLRVDAARGLCKKAGQVVSISVGMPTVLIAELNVQPIVTRL